MAEGRQVEVYTEEEGFEGAWFRAVLEEDPTGRRKVRVRYTTLLTDDGLSPLTEIIDPKLIRPVPPENLDSGVVLEEGMVVDADHRDAWWTGLVIKKELEDDNYLVCFESPPDILQFERKQLRAHLQWTGSEWVRPDIQELDDSMFCSGTMVEVSSVNKGEIRWSPAMVVKEIEEGGDKLFIVKDCNQHLRSYNGDEVARPNKTVDSCRVRPTPPPSSVEEYGLLECVEVFYGSLWRQGIVTRILSERRYRVSLKATKEEFEFKHSELRPFKVWEDGVWLNGAKSLQCQQNPVKETLDNVNAIKSKPTRSSSGAKPVTGKRSRKHMKLSSLKGNGETLTEAETVAVTGEVGKKRVDAVMTDKTPLVIVTPQVTPIARKSVSPVTPSPVITATTETVTKGKESSENGLGNDSTPHKLPEVENSQDQSRKRKREESEALITDYICDDDDYDDQPLSSWILGEKSSTKSKLSHDTTTVLPFVKHSPVWQVFESMEVFKSVKQRPHFSPLLESREEFREGLAAGEMVIYIGLLERVENLQLHTPKSTLERLRDCFAELDKYGFDVVTPISRIEMLLSLKDKQVKRLEELNDKEKKMTEEVVKKEKVEEDLREVERKILELRRQETELRGKKDASEKEIGEMQLCVSTLGKKVQDVEVEFQTIVSAPW
ncbi:unnamed protein product [Microthlaspi erraticum]|uniref:Agenet domain-containing protein n=1 Tax=Microthlaspi erraticum TaxID=1685480 RepID=A0A6D2HGC9_9BRAS|nr:unnamed protein product [Microthlaspi erraticum]